MFIIKLIFLFYSQKLALHKSLTNNAIVCLNIASFILTEFSTNSNICRIKNSRKWRIYFIFNVLKSIPNVILSSKIIWIIWHLFGMQCDTVLWFNAELQFATQRFINNSQRRFVWNAAMLRGAATLFSILQRRRAKEQMIAPARWEISLHKIHTNWKLPHPIYDIWWNHNCYSVCLICIY